MLPLRQSTPLIQEQLLRQLLLHLMHYPVRLQSNAALNQPQHRDPIYLAGLARIRFSPAQVLHRQYSMPLLRRSAPLIQAPLQRQRRLHLTHYSERLLSNAELNQPLHHDPRYLAALALLYSSPAQALHRQCSTPLLRRSSPQLLELLQPPQRRHPWHYPVLHP